MSTESEKVETHSRSIPALALVCVECDEIIEVKDPIALIRSLHLQNACPSTRSVVGGE